MMKKITSLVVALVLVAGVFGAVTASAQTVSELQAMIAKLQASLAALSGGTTTSAGATTFTSNLSVGSRGAQVSALQEALNTEVDAGLPVTGYFGALTKAAVIKFQKQNGISGTGTVGPLTRAALNALQTPTAPIVPVTPTGTTTPTPTVTGLDQTDGSLTVGVGSFVTNSQTLKKGDSKDVLSADLKAQTGKVAVNRVDVHFNTRPWYLFNTVTLKDSSGTVIATKTINSSADVTEVTSGSDYLVRFDGINVVVTPNITTTLVVGLTVNNSIDTDRFPANNQVIVDFGTTAGVSGFRSVNGLGYSDTESTTAKSTLTLSTTGNKASIDVRVSPSSPAVERPVGISLTQTTANQVLGIFSLKPQNQDVKEITDMTFTLTDTPAGAIPSSELSNLRISDGTNSYGASGFTAAGLVTFSNMHMPLKQDVWKDITLTTDVNATTGPAYKVSARLNVASIKGTDVQDNTITVNTTSNQTAANVVFTTNAMTITTSAAPAVTYVPNGQLAANTAYTTFSFTLSNGSNNNLFVSKTLGDFLGTTTNPAATASSTLTMDTALTPVSGDTDNAYVIPAGGSRAFSVTANIGRVANGVRDSGISVDHVYFGTADTDKTALQANSITTSLEQLSAIAKFAI